MTAGSIAAGNMSVATQLILSDEQILLRDSVDAYLRDHCNFEQRQHAVKTDVGFCEQRWHQFAELGWLGLPISESNDGFDGGPVETALLFEALGRHLVPEPYLETVLLAGGLLEHASATQRRRWLPGIIAGDLHGALAWSETQHTQDLQHVTLHAQREKGGWVLNGAKKNVVNASAAAVLIVTARTAGDARARNGISLFAVPAHTVGVSRRDYRSFDGRTAADINFAQVLVSDDALIGAQGYGFSLLRGAIDRAQLALCAEAVGIMARLNETTVNYARERKQFGQPIGKFQVLQHRMADMYMAYELTLSLLWATAHACANNSSDAPRLLTALCAKVGKSARYIGQNALQLHGGIAMTDELDVGHCFKRLTLIENLFGTTDHHLRRFSELSR